jgi:hypothetical protein
MDGAVSVLLAREHCASSLSIGVEPTPEKRVILPTPRKFELVALLKVQVNSVATVSPDWTYR